MAIKSFQLRKNDNIIGSITWEKNEIRTLLVEQEYRRKGYGSDLLKKAELEIQKNYTQVILLAYSSEPGVKTFYFKNGYWEPSFIKRWFLGLPQNYLIKDFK